jgi:hypothetical protein
VTAGFDEQYRRWNHPPSLMTSTVAATAVAARGQGDIDHGSGPDPIAAPAARAYSRRELMTSTATLDVRIALSFHSLRRCASGRAFCVGGRAIFAAIRFSLARVRLETTGRNGGVPSSSTAVTYSCCSYTRVTRVRNMVTVLLVGTCASRSRCPQR